MAPVTSRLLWLLDTNVLSNTPGKLPNAACEARLKRNQAHVAVPAPVWHELTFGWLRMPAGARKDAIGNYLRNVVGRLPMLPYDDVAARLHAEDRAAAERAGRPRPYADGQIAAIAVAHGLTLATRNLRDFRDVAGLKSEDWFAGEDDAGAQHVT